MPVERVPTHLAVRDDVEPRVFLQRDGFVDRAILDLFEVSRRHVATFERGTRLEEISRAKKATDDIGASGEEIGHDVTGWSQELGAGSWSV
jgi:hypothetical protein